jgi:hypothetical protein
MQLATQQNKQTLIVEDEGIIAADIQSRLERLGYKVPAIARQATNGDCYRTAALGGDSGGGSLSVGLGPFVRTQTTSGEVAAAVQILEAI